MAELALKVKFLAGCLQIRDPSKNRLCLCIRKDNLFLKHCWGLGTEGVRFVTLEGGTPKEVLLGTDKLLRGLFVCEEEHLLRDISATTRHLMLKGRPAASIRTANKALGSILNAFTVDILVAHMLAAETADKFVFLQFTCVTID